MGITPGGGGAGFSNGPGVDQPEQGNGIDTVEFYEDKAGEWRWRYQDANGDILADSGQGYENEAAARSGAGRVTGFAAEVKTARRGLRFEHVEA